MILPRPLARNNTGKKGYNAGMILLRPLTRKNNTVRQWYSNTASQSKKSRKQNKAGRGCKLFCSKNVYFGLYVIEAVSFSSFVKLVELKL
jgi:predicted amidophosphoribosyltransferase